MLEKEKCDLKTQTDTKSLELSLHIENEINSEDLDSSQGVRFCKRCDYEAEDRYDLDGHIWTEHEEDEDGTICCKFCDEKFANIPNLMTHKKIKHREKIDYCKNECWFRH